MLQQIDESIRFDCHDMPAPVANTGAEWLAMTRERADRDARYAAKHLAEERQRAEERTAWVQALKASLPVVAS